MLSIKKIIRRTGRSVRIVPNKTPALNSAQVLHNRLTSRGAWELLFISDAHQTVLAQTLFVQDIEAYAARDQVRPFRDARVGMLPPKLAQIMLNLARPSNEGVVLDPFCGSGVVLQEALLMGFETIGSDIKERMVQYSIANLKWLEEKFGIPSDRSQVFLADATNHQWLGRIDAVVSETYLGKPLKFLPDESQLKKIIDEVDKTLKKFLLNLSQQLDHSICLCLAVPAWRRSDGQLIHLPIIDRLTDMGYTYLDLKHVRGSELVYFREDQTVSRQLLLLKKV
jgi:tRNA G10  N-methylase Trm11